MKSKHIILASALLISVIAFAQKDQIKAADKALKAGNAREAITILQEAETASATAPDDEKAQYFFIKGNAHLALANKKVKEGESLNAAAKSYQDLLAVEKASGKNKYSTQAATSITTIKNKLLNSSIEDTKAEKHSKAAKKLYDAYLLDKKDTINLYYAAGSYVNAKEYDQALKLYSDLKTLNYSGKGVSYFAISKTTGQEDSFNSAKTRDFSVKIGTYEKPRTAALPSKRGEIYKNIALILIQEGKIEEAKKAIADARKTNPEDNSLIYKEANLYLDTKDYETYKKLVGEALEKNPNDTDLIFNLGMISANAKNPAEAEKYYKRVIEVDPKYTNAYINLTALKLEDEKPINVEMDKLSTSAKDMKRYAVLKTKKEDLYKSSIPYLQKAIELEPTNVGVAKTLLSIYSALEMMPEAKALKEKIKANEPKN